MYNSHNLPESHWNWVYQYFSYWLHTYIFILLSIVTAVYRLPFHGTKESIDLIFVSNMSGILPMILQCITHSTHWIYLNATVLLWSLIQKYLPVFISNVNIEQIFFVLENTHFITDFIFTMWIPFLLKFRNFNCCLELLFQVFP